MSEPVMASIICTNFAQNAWKKDLCSNCFKSEVEHNNCSVGSSHPTTTTTTQTLTKTDKQNDNHFHTNEETNGKTNHSAIKPLAKSANIFTSNNFIQQINTNNSIQKSVPKECIKTSGNINGNHINVKKFSTNINTLTINSGNNNNQLNSQIVMNNTKIKLNSTHVSSQQSLESCNNKLLVKNTVNSDSTERNGIIPLLQQQQQKSSKSENKSFSNNENNLKTNNKSAVVDNLGTNNSVTTNVPNVTNVLNHNKDTNGCGSPVSATNSTLMLTKGILKSQTNEDLIKYRPKNRCIVFKDGDPLVIGCGDIDYEYSSDSDDDYEASDDDTEDDYIYSSDDKELRDLTYKNTLFNANYANFKKFIDNKYKNNNNFNNRLSIKQKPN
ncbi:putative uncharacterized protein DDB_G0286901 [Oppia nitens]|uniref:putative uncharacterized protein DDB_G0286901 n=1 Tax=Oppia nitens TaxID=1686743 RepID=UPI0023DC44AE|nr:putative uncharacterized protein DDB_G0286901 [Oppia nitens]